MIISELIGGFGRYQLGLCALVFISQFGVAFHQMAIIFLAPPAHYSCPGEEPEYDKTVFTRTIVMEWHLICERSWMKDFTQTLFQFGVLSGSLLIGIASDRYGRKPTLVASVILEIFSGMMTSFLPDYWSFTIIRMILGFAVGGENMVVGSNKDLVSDPEESAENYQPTSEDVTATVLGTAGRWQFKISVLMSLLKLSLGWYQLAIIFMAPVQDFWCAKPKEFERYSDEEWRDMCSPKIQEHPCLIYDPEILLAIPNIDKSLIRLVPCKKFVYDKSGFSRTMTSDWDLVCSEHWKVHITQSLLMCGVLVGGVVFGRAADTHGRQKSLMVSIIMQAVCGFIACWLPRYDLFLINWFMLALSSGGITIISFVICMEAVSGKWRMTVPILYQVPFGIGTAIMALLAYWLRDWRKLLFSLAVLSSLYIPYWYWLPESPRWLIANGQNDKAADVLYAAAKENGLPWTKEDIRKLLPKPSKEKKIAPNFTDFLKSKNMRLKTVLLSINWFCTGLGFYAFSQYLGGIGGNAYLTVSATGLISTAGPIFCMFIITNVGRKTAIWVFQLLTALCFVAIFLLPKDRFVNDWPIILFAGVGFAGMGASVPTLYLYCGELYPTLGRNIGVGGVTTFARVGSMIAPLVVGLEGLWPCLPIILLAAISFAQMLLLLPLPETKDSMLPDTLEQAEQFRRVKKSHGRKEGGALWCTCGWFKLQR